MISDLIFLKLKSEQENQINLVRTIQIIFEIDLKSIFKHFVFDRHLMSLMVFTINEIRSIMSKESEKIFKETRNQLKNNEHGVDYLIEFIELLLSMFVCTKLVEKNMNTFMVNFMQIRSLIRRIEKTPFIRFIEFENFEIWYRICNFCEKFTNPVSVFKSFVYKLKCESNQVINNFINFLAFIDIPASLKN